MNIDISVLKSLLKIEYWDKYYQVVNKKHYKVNSKEIYNILLILEKLRSEEPFNERDISIEELQLAFQAKAFIKNEDEQILYEQIFLAIEQDNVEAKLVESLFKKHLDQVKASEVFTIADDVIEGKRSYDEIVQFVEEHKEEVKFEYEFVSDDLATLLRNTVQGEGLNWRLPFLQQALGPLRKGDFGFVFARPETGKTTFLASEVSYMAEQLANSENGPVLWFNNEEQGDKVKIRVYQGVLGVTQRELLSNVDKYNILFNEKIKSKFKLLDEAVLSKWMVERIVKKFNPGLILFDQIDKIQGFAADREDIVLGKIYQWARELAKTYCPVIGICQAGNSGEGKLYMQMDDVDRSKTSKQAEADFIIAIGKDHDLHEHVRGIHIIKNKLSGDEHTEEALRHGKRKVLIVPDIARYMES